jgi:hypothetical protein
MFSSMKRLLGYKLSYVLHEIEGEEKFNLKGFKELTFPASKGIIC